MGKRNRKGRFLNFVRNDSLFSDSTGQEILKRVQSEDVRLIIDSNDIIKGVAFNGGVARVPYHIYHEISAVADF